MKIADATRAYRPGRHGNAAFIEDKPRQYRRYSSTASFIWQFHWGHASFQTSSLYRISAPTYYSRLMPLMTRAADEEVKDFNDALIDTAFNWYATSRGASVVAGRNLLPCWDRHARNARALVSRLCSYA